MKTRPDPSLCRPADPADSGIGRYTLTPEERAEVLALNARRGTLRLVEDKNSLRYRDNSKRKFELRGRPR